MEIESKNKSPKIWKSLEEYRQDPEWSELAEKEFKNSPWSEEDEKKEGGWARREFLKLMGASIAMSSFACVRKPVHHIVPYVKAPTEITPGIANYYASTWSDGGEVYGLIVKTREGRPIKLEGNPLHPVNRGSLSARGQAQVLGLYDPDRVTGPRKFNPDAENPFQRQQHPLWPDLDLEISEVLKQGGIAVLTGSHGSPSTQAVIDDFCQAHRAQHYVWDPINYDDVIKGQELSYGKAVLPRYRFDRAKMIVSIDTDFLGTYMSPDEFNRAFAQGRELNENMNKLVCFESILSLTGANSDFRIRIAASQQLDVVMGLLHEIIVVQKRSAYANDSAVTNILKPYDKVAHNLGVEPALFAKIASDLWVHKGQSLIVAGGLATRTSDTESLQIATNFLNTVLENDGVTIDYSRAASLSHAGRHADIQTLINRMERGEIKTLIINRVNPVYSLPKDSGFEEALKKVTTVISTNDRVDETSVYAKYLAPDHHHLENWGDVEAHSGVLSIQQPTIRPLYDTRAFQDSLLVWSGKKTSWYDYLRNRWKKYASGDFEKFWVDLLQKGILDRSQKDSVSGRRSFNKGALSRIRTQVKNTQNLELVLYPTVQLGDGRDANISWLQELPDPITKATWGSYVTMSPKTAEERKLKNGRVVRLKAANGDIVEVPVKIQPGQHDKVLGLAVGNGRARAGQVGNNVGVNAFKLANFLKGKPVFSAQPVEIEATSKYDEIANTEGHSTMEGRQIIVQATLNEYLKKNDVNIHKHKVFSIWPEKVYKGHRWGMAIDLNKCTGCSACVIACQSENNIPVVGKKYVIQGREMHWIRIDRYYSGTPENPETSFQPMLCQHCGTAPCETVCPVVATTHSDEGINEMTYNRCVGTRYCSNNCPYKVRRFNWFNYSKKQVEPINMALNPDVTVRSRGVMEKCTFCIQRIKTAKNEVLAKGEKLKDGMIKTACEQTCPTQAIVFGDMNDPESRVSKLFKEKRTYSVLEEFNTQPSVRYMTKVRNTEKTTSEDHHHSEGGHA